MATYTIELGKLLTLDGFDIGMNDYPLPSFLDSAENKKAWREALNKKIINHYYFNEICCLPPDRFKLFLNNTLNEKMPYFNMLYDAMAEKWQFYTGGTLNEVIKADGTSSDNGTKTGTDVLARSGIDTIVNSSTSSNSHNDYTLNVNSDTPAQMLNIEYDIANNTYASSANKNKNNGTNTGNSTSTDTTTYNSKETTTLDEHTTADRQHNDNRNRTVSGLSNKSYAELFKEYSESVRNLDLEVIDSLKDCFMGIF
jgi:hypothetical protein